VRSVRLRVTVTVGGVGVVAAGASSTVAGRLDSTIRSTSTPVAEPGVDVIRCDPAESATVVAPSHAVTDTAFPAASAAASSGEIASGNG